MDGFRISLIVEEQLNRNLSVVLYDYITGSNFQRSSDFFRGNLDICFSLNLISIKSYVFLVNFLYWLDCKPSFNEVDDDMYRFFYDQIVEDMDFYLNDNNTA